VPEEEREEEETADDWSAPTNNFINLASQTVTYSATVIGNFISQTSKTVYDSTVGVESPLKTKKYELMMQHFHAKIQDGEGRALCKAVFDGEESELRDLCNQLTNIILNPDKRKVREQKDLFLQTLRLAAAELKEKPKMKGSACEKFVHFLALDRFAGFPLYAYCKELVESCSEQLPPFINLDNFWNVLENRNEKIKKLSKKDGITKPALLWQKLAGALNFRDFLFASNIPYIYGQLKINGHVVTVLRHGTPIALYWKSWFQLPKSQVTEDYTAFIEAAAEKKQNILHLIAENKMHEFEGVRVEQRLELSSYENFYPWAIRFDGDFIEPKTYTPVPFSTIRERFLKEMYGKNTGYVVPNKLQKVGLSEEDFEGYMKTVQKTFFSNISEPTKQEFQAFVVLTYAEATLALCQKLNITYLEALCKDDIDRGGAMKAVIVLLHLHKTGLFGQGREKELSQALEQLMVSIIAAPLLVKKQPILKNRASYIKSVIEVIKKAVQNKPLYSGDFTVLSGSSQGFQTDPL
jgi:hypothetical protein